MTGLENIIKQIENESAACCRDIASKAENAADERIAAAKKDAENTVKRYEELANIRYEEIIKRAASNDDLEYKRAVLSKKQEIIKAMIDKVRTELSSNQGDEYFELLESLLKKNVQNQGGIIILSERDRKNISASFKALLEENKLEISEKALKSGGGFILVYGSIEVNCTFDAVFDAYNDELSDMLNEFLFGGEGGV